MYKRSPRVLILDKHKELAMAYRDRLAMENLTCINLASATQALDYIEAFGCDLIVLDDYTLGEISFRDFMDLLSTLNNYKKQPVMVLSSNPSYEPTEGADEYILKTATDAGAVVKRIIALV
jgi:DNA-binding response OmpR family regulator